MKFQFRIAHLLLLFPAYGLAIIFAPGTHGYGVLVSYTYVNEGQNIRNLDLLLHWLENREGVKLTEETLPRWATGRLTKEESEQPGFEMLATGDNWGHPYQFVPKKPSDKGEASVGVYSLGADGISRSNGNDPDDICSWSDHYWAHYREVIAAEDRRDRAIGGILLTPITYLIVLGGLRLVRGVRQLMKR